MNALMRCCRVAIGVSVTSPRQFDADACRSGRTLPSTFLLPDRCMFFTASAGVPDFSAISRSCSSMTARAGASPSRPPRTPLGTANVGNPASVWDIGEAHALGLEVTTSELRRAEDISPAFDALKGRADALYVCVDPLVNPHRIRVNTLALAARLSTMHGLREYVEAGGLMSYGPNLPDLLRRAADYVDKILRGAKPGDIPVEQPTRFDLVINLTTAKALGLTLPPTLLALAEEVIE